MARGRRLCGRVLVATVIGVAVAALGVPNAAPVMADTVTSKRAEAAALARQIDAQGREIEVLAEQYNGAQLQADQAAQGMAAATQALGQARIDFATARSALAEEALAAYTHGGYLAMPQLARYSGQVNLAVQRDYFRLATNSQTDRLDGLRAAAQRLKEEQAAFAAARRGFEVAGQAVAEHRQAVEKAVADNQATLGRVKGELAQLVAQQEVELEARRQAQARAQLAARLAEAARRAEQEAAAAARARLAAAGGTRIGSGGILSGTGPAARPPAPPRLGPLPPSSGSGRALAFARAQLGKPYEWGAAGPGAYDCSGLTMMSWRAAGVSLPHYAAGQYANTAHIPISHLQPGDLVFFGSDLHHVGIYAGGGSMIDAPHSGAVVRYDSIYWPDLQPYGGRPG